MTEEVREIDLTNEQVNNIVGIIIEEVLLKMPKVIGNLMAQQATANKMKQDFYKQYPEFIGNEDVVVQVIEKKEGEDLNKTIDIILRESVPEIREKILIKSKLNMESLNKKEEINMNLHPNTEVRTISGKDETNFENDNGVI